jgi:predicted RNA binding protein YcfA (HicA-like mRNA interferase family)
MELVLPAKGRLGSPKVKLGVRPVNPFPSMKAKRLLAVLERKPLGYRVARQSGSHRRMESLDYPPLTFAMHDKATIPAGLVRKILVRDVSLAEDEARKLL